MTSHREGARLRGGLIRGMGAALISLGLALAVFCGFMLWGTNVAGDQASAQILELASEELGQSSVAGAPTPEGTNRPAATGDQVPGAGGDTGRDVRETQSAVENGELIAVVTIPSIDVEIPVLEGMDGDILDEGVLGHYPGTQSPGEVGNFAVAGHRTTHGAPLYDIDEIEVGDAIVVQTSQGWDVYAMERQRVVDPAAIEVIAPVPDDPDATATSSWMVLTSCHPKLSAEKRMIAYASLDRHVPRSEGPPAELD
ncbi:MAG: class E sortase [Ornithinimicrobium sp.]